MGTHVAYILKQLMNSDHSKHNNELRPLLMKNANFDKGILDVHDDVIKWKHLPHYWPFVRGIHWLPMNSPHKGQWRGTLMLSLICAWTNGWVNNWDAGDYHDVTLMRLCNHIAINNSLGRPWARWGRCHFQGQPAYLIQMPWWRYDMKTLSALLALCVWLHSLLDKQSNYH